MSDPTCGECWELFGPDGNPGCIIAGKSTKPDDPACQPVAALLECRREMYGILGVLKRQTRLIEKAMLIPSGIMCKTCFSKDVAMRTAIQMQDENQ
jgi:hypothetical protein